VPIVLYRVDERLIHGQVVIGWGHELRPDRFVIVDEELATSDWEQDLYRVGAAPSEVLFFDVEQARAAVSEWQAAPQRTILLTRDIETMWALARGGLLRGAAINLGGIHHGPGRVEVLTFLHLSAEDRTRLLDMETEGVAVSARELPDAPKIPLASILRAAP
jgi:PTS system mannose-specific IIB component/fructoselysine and glucoselysine-specific PTS system IIB component